MDRWGLTLPLPGLSLAEHESLVKGAEAAGYTDLWTGETAGPDGFTPLALAAAWTEQARLGTGIVGGFQRGPALLAQQAVALSDASGGRFVLGLGSSSDRIVEGWNGIPFEKPLSRVRETLDFLDPVLAGERSATGFKLETAPPHEVPIVLAALRGKMLDLALQRAAGAFTNFLPLSGLPKVTAQLQDPPTGFELLCRFFCIPASASRLSRWPASCSPPTSPSRSTPTSTAGSATASRFSRWSMPGRQATVRRPPQRRPGRRSRRCSSSARPTR